MVHKFKVSTSGRCEMSDITKEVQGIVRENGLESGVCHVFVPHTTCALAVNENADPDVKADIQKKLCELVPEESGYKHAEGNSDAHIKAVLAGSSLSVFVEDGALLLGTWQGLYLCEYDGPRAREVWVKLLRG
ncbi:MAG: secondary thiamine-phosphate synthase enzyme YjbQ [Elusimicrobia bacterium]|nr:secondary thiamine-phosphate synthase enzyme YjbQ [Elusimicrobiota bacterium]